MFVFIVSLQIPNVSLELYPANYQPAQSKRKFSGIAWFYFCEPCDIAVDQAKQTGEDVDVANEAPPLPYGDDEIGRASCRERVSSVV